MAKKKAARSGPGVGTKIRVREGITMPEFPSVNCSGWTGEIVDTAGGKENPQFVIEWDSETKSRLPQSYIDDCEKKQLLFTMACLPGETLEFPGEPV